MVFHENCLLADDSHEISPYFFRKLGNISQNLLSAADNSFRNINTFSNGLNPDQDQQNYSKDYQQKTKVTTCKE